MTQEEIIENFIQNLSEMLRITPFTFEFKVKKHPQGFKIIYEVTQEDMDRIITAVGKDGITTHYGYTKDTAD